MTREPIYITIQGPEETSLLVPISWEDEPVEQFLNRVNLTGPQALDFLRQSLSTVDIPNRDLLKDLVRQLMLYIWD